MNYDLHIHTHYSRCSNLKPEIILKVAQRKGLDGIAVVDHGTMRGAALVHRLNKNKDFKIIVGAELKTQYGEVLAYNLNNEIKSNDLFEVLDEIKKQGALAVLPHPFAIGLGRKNFSYDISKIKNKLNALETFNGRCFFNCENTKAKQTAEKLDIAQTAGSDAHFAFEIGNAVTIFDDDLRQALKKRQTAVNGTTKTAFLGRGLSFVEKYLVRALK